MEIKKKIFTPAVIIRIILTGILIYGVSREVGPFTTIVIALNALSIEGYGIAIKIYMQSVEGIVKSSDSYVAQINSLLTKSGRL